MKTLLMIMAIALSSSVASAVCSHQSNAGILSQTGYAQKTEKPAAPNVQKSNRDGGPVKKGG